MLIPKSQVPKDKNNNIWKNSLRSETRKRGEGTRYINSGQKLARLHRKSQRPNSLSHHGVVCLQQCSINPRGQVSIVQHQTFLLK